jgi:CRP-like cAMP-binding protein
MGIETILKRAELFLGLDDAALLKIAELPSSDKAAFSPGEIIFKYGARAKYLYVLARGQVDLVADFPSEYRRVRENLLIDTVTIGGCFGWSALVRPHFYVMSAVCTKPTEVVTINGAELMGLLEDDNHIGYSVFQSLSHIIGARLRDVEKTLARFLHYQE